jgi:polyribonucleotide nucleotidyltransferase
MNIKTDKIKDVIGTGGKVINKIIEETGVKIDISEDGKVVVYSIDKDQAQKALDKIEMIVREIEVGEYYDGIVTKIMPFGAFIDIGGGKEGLLHISKISKERVEKVEDVLSVGDRIIVKVLDIDHQGKISLKKIGEQETNS